MDLLKNLFGTEQYDATKTDTRADSPDPDPNDVWAFTDPDARDLYAERGKLKELEHDIRYEVMRGEPWQGDELAYKLEIRRLLREGIVRDKGTYWFASPFPTVYQALKPGFIRIGEKLFPFSAGDEIVFQCRMTRDMNPELRGPVRIGRFSRAEGAKLCRDMGGAMKGMQGMD